MIDPAATVPRTSPTMSQLVYRYRMAAARYRTTSNEPFRAHHKAKAWPQKPSRNRHDPQDTTSPRAPPHLTYCPEKTSATLAPKPNRG